MDFKYMQDHIQSFFEGDTCLYESTALNKVVLVVVHEVHHFLNKWQYYVESINEKYPIKAFTTAPMLTKVFGEKNFHVPSEEELSTLVGGES